MNVDVVKMNSTMLILGCSFRGTYHKCDIVYLKWVYFVITFLKACKRYSELQNSISLQLTVQKLQAVMCYIYCDCDRAQVIEKSGLYS